MLQALEPVGAYTVRRQPSGQRVLQLFLSPKVCTVQRIYPSVDMRLHTDLCTTCQENNAGFFTRPTCFGMALETGQLDLAGEVSLVVELLHCCIMNYSRVFDNSGPLSTDMPVW